MTSARGPQHYQVLSRSRKSGHVSYTPFGGYFGIPLTATTQDWRLADCLRLEVKGVLGDDFEVWVHACEPTTTPDDDFDPLDRVV